MEGSSGFSGGGSSGFQFCAGAWMPALSAVFRLFSKVRLSALSSSRLSRAGSNERENDELGVVKFFEVVYAYLWERCCLYVCLCHEAAFAI